MGVITRNYSPSNIVSFTTESAVTDGNVVVIGSTAQSCALPSGADPTEGVLGVVVQPNGETLPVGSLVSVLLLGVYMLRASGSISVGDNLAIASSSGNVKSAAPSVASNTFAVGLALETVTDGQRFSALIRPTLLQG